MNRPRTPHAAERLPFGHPGIRRTANAWSPRGAARLRSVQQYALRTAACFIILSLLLAFQYRSRGDAVLSWQVRAGILRDLIREMPIGRQALVSCPWAMPLPTVLALPFAVLLPARAYALAYLYGLALAAAPAAVPLASMLRRVRVPAAYPAAVAALAAAAVLAGPTAQSDLVAFTGCAIIAAWFDLQRDRVLRALAGVFYGLALLSHPVGLFLVLGRVLWMIVQRLRGLAGAEGRAVQWTQAAGMAYALCVYLFLGWMIMRGPLWPARRFQARLPGACSPEARRELADVLARRYPAAAPVASGLWGYAVEPVLKSAGGHQFIDFHPDKVPDWEWRELVLVVPKPVNPLVSLCDVAGPLHRNPAAVTRFLFLSESPNWEYYLVVRGPAQK